MPRIENENENTGHILVKIDEESFFEPKSEEKADDTTKETRYWILYEGYIIKEQGDPYDGTLIYELSLKVAQDPEDMTDYETDSYEHYILEGSIYHFDKEIRSKVVVKLGLKSIDDFNEVPRDDNGPPLLTPFKGMVIGIKSNFRLKEVDPFIKTCLSSMVFAHG